ncbi:MAG: hypothetical protein HQM10_08100 [Candidatus Riflebacteria bacterium]|nr:hypothetical protein [Candidatus Riflebacteria bacterium]
MKIANKCLFEGNYLKAVENYAKAPLSDPALRREALLGSCLCYAMLALQAQENKNPADAVKYFIALIEESKKSVPLEGLSDGNIFVNSGFIVNLVKIFEKIGNFGVGDVSQNEILQKDSNFQIYSPNLDKYSTDAQKEFGKFFSVSMTLSDATCELEKNNYSGCKGKAGAIQSKSEHITKSAEVLQKHCDKMIEAINLLTILRSKAETIKDNDPVKPEIIELIENIEKLIRGTNTN